MCIEEARLVCQMDIICSAAEVASVALVQQSNIPQIHKTCSQRARVCLIFWQCYHPNQPCYSIAKGELI